MGLGETEDFAAAAERLKKQRAAEEAAKSEQQKLAERATKAEQEQQRLLAQVQRHEDLAFLRRHAKTAGLVDDDDAQELVLGRMRSFSAGELKLKAGERPSAEQMTEFFTGLKKEKPFLFGGQQPGEQRGSTTGGDGGAPGGGRGSGNQQPVDFLGLTREQRLAEARKRGWA